MAKLMHTPGPWKIGQDATALMGCPEGGCFMAIDGPGHGALAVVVTRLADDTEPNAKLEGNARLIAAAPELLDSLCAMLLEHDAGGVTMATSREARALIAHITEAE